MGDSSGNIKLLVGVILGAVVAVGVVSLTRSEPPKPAAAPAPAAAAPVAKEQPALVAPAPTPATKTGDWRGKVEVGESAPPQPAPAAVPSSRSDIRNLVSMLAKQMGGRDKLAALKEATWTLTVKQGERQMTRIVELVGARGLRLTDPLQGLVAVWKRDGSCKERRGVASGPCSAHLKRFAETVYSAHLTHVVALLGKRFVRPIRVKSGMGERLPWTLMTFKIRKSALRLVMGVDTRAFRARAALTTVATDNTDFDRLDKADAAGDKGAEANKETELYPGLSLRTSLAATAWRPFHDGARLPSRFCRTIKSSVTKLIDSEGTPDEACELEMQLVSVKPGVTKGALRLGRGNKLRESVGAQHVFIRADVTDATLWPVIDKLRKDLPKERFVRNGTFFALNGAKVQLCEEMRGRDATTHELPSRPRVVLAQYTTTLAGLPKAFAELEAKAKAAGYQVIDGPRLARPDTREQPQPGQPLKMMLEVPVASN